MYLQTAGVAAQSVSNYASCSFALPISSVSVNQSVSHSVTHPWAVGLQGTSLPSLTPLLGQFLLSPSCAGLITFARGLRLFFSLHHLPFSF